MEELANRIMRPTCSTVEQGQAGSLDESRKLSAETCAKAGQLKQRYREAVQDNPPRGKTAKPNGAKQRKGMPTTLSEPERQQDTAVISAAAPSAPVPKPPAQAGKASAKRQPDIADAIPAAIQPPPEVPGQVGADAAERQPATADAVPAPTQRGPEAPAQAGEDVVKRQPEIADAVSVLPQPEAPAQVGEDAAERQPAIADAVPTPTKPVPEQPAQAVGEAANGPSMPADDRPHRDSALKQRYASALLNNPHRVKKPGLPKT